MTSEDSRPPLRCGHFIDVRSIANGPSVSPLPQQAKTPKADPPSIWRKLFGG